MIKKRFITAAVFSAMLLLTAPALTQANPGGPRGGQGGFDESEFQGNGPQRGPGDWNGQGMPNSGPPRGKNGPGMQGYGPQQNQGFGPQQGQGGPGQQNQNRQRGFMAHLDRDNSGTVSREEFRGPDRLFSRLDSNGDGFIDSSEAPQGPPLRQGMRRGPGGPGMMGPGGQNGSGMQGQGYGPQQGPGGQGGPGMQGQGPMKGPGGQGGQRNFMTDFDKDNSGNVSRDEFPGPDQLFARLDRNNDGSIDSSEAPKGPPPRRNRNNQNGPGMQGQGYGPPQGPGNNQNGPGMQGQGFGPPQGPGNNQNGPGYRNQTGPHDFLKDLDRDGNGAVSRDEFPGPDRMFSHLDRNNDGSIDSSEVPQMPQGPGNGQNVN